MIVRHFLRAVKTQVAVKEKRHIIAYADEKWCDGVWWMRWFFIPRHLSLFAALFPSMWQWCSIFLPLPPIFTTLCCLDRKCLGLTRHPFTGWDWVHRFGCSIPFSFWRCRPVSYFSLGFEVERRRNNDNITSILLRATLHPPPQTWC